jgi:hypothetical protein
MKKYEIDLHAVYRLIYLIAIELHLKQLVLIE